MADLIGKKEKVEPIEARPNLQEQINSSEQEKTEKIDAKEDAIVSAELRREIELMNVDDNLKKLAEQKANKISFLADDDKLKHLLQVAKEKGVLFAIQTAKKMNDPFLLDTLHDALAREGYYKDFTKK